MAGGEGGLTGRPAKVVSAVEEALHEGESTEADFPVFWDVVARLGLADVAAFGLS